jgi:hypothetical protein
MLVDVYGNVPYTDALKGSQNPTPKYDKGVDIYKALFRDIDAGIALINAAVITTTNPNKNIVADDIMFHADVTKWNQFGNTLKLRMLIHAYAVAAIDKAAEMLIINNNGNGFLTADALVNPGYSGNDKPNPFFTQYITKPDASSSTSNVYYAANEWGINYYAWDGDPRRSQDRVYTGGGGHLGVPYGKPPIAQYASAVVAHIGAGVYKSATASQVVISAAESYFLQSEARFRNIITSGPTADVLLTSAINASFAYYGATGAAGYIAGNASYPDVDYFGVSQGTGAPAGGLFTILSQKWFAMNGVNPLETWSDWRRVPYSEVATKVLFNNSNAPTTNFVYGDGGGFTNDASNFPGATPGVGPFRSVSPQIGPTDNIPVRFLYPQSEYNYNTANVAAEGTITRYSRVFWDLN